ncbi:MAG: cobyric acid synthase [Candidatus Rokubacteria bacterium]|nr:cobyric acid synthase [Candidatus Rokubacteria bacterium]
MTTPRPAPCLMVQGTASGAGKSTLVAALCRIFRRRGWRVAPFKAQNMALNAAVTSDGGEIGRAQAAQAEAAGVEPTVDMNPILLKPEAEDRSQLVVRGIAVASVDFDEYARMTPLLLPVVAESLARLRAGHDLVVIEGAGSPAEINLNAHEIVNMRIARLAAAPVLLVGDVDRGGVFAALVGTLALLEPDDRARVRGLVVNKFRGDRRLLEPGLDELARRTGVPVLGVVPWIPERLVPEEDSLVLEAPAPRRDPAALDIAVMKLPRIANFDDLEPLAAEPGVGVRFVRARQDLGAPDLIVVPGSKSTVADLGWLRAIGLAEALQALAARGTPVLGLCGGYQMLGATIEDPAGIESSTPVASGLGLLPVVTRFACAKTTRRVRARVLPEAGLLAGAAGAEVTGYEIHAGDTDTGGARRPFAVLERGGRPAAGHDGAVSDDGLVLGSYLHGVFANPALRRALLVALAAHRGLAADPRWGTGPAIDPYDRLADIVEAALDVGAIEKLVQP